MRGASLGELRVRDGPRVSPARLSARFESPRRELLVRNAWHDGKTPNRAITERPGNHSRVVPECNGVGDAHIPERRATLEALVEASDAEDMLAFASRDVGNSAGANVFGASCR